MIIVKQFDTNQPLWLIYINVLKASILHRYGVYVTGCTLCLFVLNVMVRRPSATLLTAVIRIMRRLPYVLLAAAEP